MEISHVQLRQRLSPWLQAVLFGLAGALAAIAFHAAIEWTGELGLGRLEHMSVWSFSGWMLLVITTTSLLSGWLLVRFCPEAAGSGIPQTKSAFWIDNGMIPWRVACVKFCAGLLSIGGGASLGREGPSVQLGASAASTTAGWLGTAKHQRRLAAAAGAAAGLAAAFNAPLAAVTFVLEEILEDLHSKLLGSVIVAAVVGALATHAVFGKQPAFLLGTIDKTSWTIYLLVPITAALAAAVGILFQKMCLGLRQEAKSWEKIPNWIRPLVGALVTWAVGTAVFALVGHSGVFGLGFRDMSTGLAGNIPAQIALLLLAGKLIATVASYGTGGCGGIFAPSLFLGGMCAIALNGFYGLIFTLSPDDRTLLAVVGLSACLGAVVKAPMTSILIVFEMTHQFELVPALLIGQLVASGVSRWLSKWNFYEAVLRQDGVDLARIMPPRNFRSWAQRPAATIAQWRPIAVAELSAEAAQQALAAGRHQRYPVLQNGLPVGIASLAEVETWAKGKLPASLSTSIPTAEPDMSIQDLSEQLVKSDSGMVALVDGNSRHLVAIVTLHDLVRAQLSLEDTF